jgi:raffinose/stachyose/melibiose transport system substrate-binding protein
MSLSRKKLLPLVIASAVATAVLAACGSSSGQASGKVTLVIASWQNTAGIQQLDAAFEKTHPNVNIQFQTAPTGNNAYSTLTNTLLSSKQVDILAQFAPDPSTFAPSSTGIAPSGTLALIKSGQLTNLANEPFMKQYQQSAEQFGAGYNGGVYGLVSAEFAQSGQVWYKPDLLAKYHMSLPTTYNQLLNDCKILKSNGIGCIFVAGQTGLQANIYDGIFTQQLAAAHPGQSSQTVLNNLFQSFLSGQANYNSPQFVTAANNYVQLAQYVEPSASGVAQLNAPGEWASQPNNYPFFVDGTWDGTTIAQANPSLKFGTYAFPGTNTPGANVLTPFLDMTWTVPTWAPQKKVAMEWLSFFSQKSNYQNYLKQTGSLSLQPGVATPDPWMGWINSHIAQSFLVPNTYQPWLPPHPKGVVDGPTLPGSPLLQQMVPFGGESVTAALDSAASAYSQATANLKKG